VSPANSTVVRFNTVSGTIDVRMYDTATPLSVANFLNYLNSGRYNGTFIHRSIPGFVIQGGGYTYDAETGSAPHIATFAPVQNEFGISNVRGTIAMAKLGGDPNSATSEWFFNLSDNSSNLDNQNGGFTVFGRVVASGMTVVDAIAALPRFDLDPSGSTFDTVPLRTGATLADRLVFVNTFQILNFKAGDYDFNGTVNAADYTVWRNTLGSTTNAEADGNGNGKVDAADYVLWRKTLGQSGGPGAGSGAGLDSFGVPEPSSGILILLAGASLTFFRARFSARRVSRTQ
jgi:cyclophilin family peptidyl-prolyl cis-trans isomerase